MQLEQVEKKLRRSAALQTKRTFEKTGKIGEQREWFEVALSSIGEAVIATGIDGKVSFLNRMAETMTGCKSNPTIGQPLQTVLRLINAETREPVRIPVPAVLREGIVAGLPNEAVLLFKEGREMAVEGSVAPIRNATGKILGAVVVLRDVTEKRKTEKVWREEALLFELLNKTGTAIAAQLGLKSLVQMVTNTGAELIGAKVGAFCCNCMGPQGETFSLCTLGGTPCEAPPKYGRPQNAAIFDPKGSDHGVVRSDDITQDPRYEKLAPTCGISQWQTPVRSYLAVPVISRSGEMIGGLFYGHPEAGVFTERSERLIVGMAAQAAGAIDNARLSEMAHRQSAERKQLEEIRYRLAAVVESSDDAILSKTLDGIITTWNKAAERLYGYTADEVIGKPVTILIPPDRLDEEPVIIERLKRGLRIDHYETVRMRKDGTFLDVSLTVSPIKDADGKIIGASKTARDITERKRTEAALRQAKDELEKRVEERTASLRETTEQLESFCYTIAHDLRSPLRAQQSFAQVLLDDYSDSLDEVGREYAQRIINSAQRLDNLVNDLLVYSRISQDALKLEELDLEKLVKDICLHLAGEIATQHAEISFGAFQPVLAYAPTLNLVITNLVTNALKFVRANVPARIRIWSERRENFVRLWVEDNGIGIDLQHRGKIFGVFERLHPIDKYPGTGIGLAIVQKGVSRMGGRLGVESELGTGSRFWIELPVA